MSLISDYLASQLLNCVFNAVPLTTPPGIYIALMKSPAVSNTPGANLAEPSTIGTGYQRVAVTRDMNSWFLTNNKLISNSTAFIYPAPTNAAGWGLITNLAVTDAMSSGNLLFTTKLTKPTFINQGRFPPPIIDDGNLKIGLQGDSKGFVSNYLGSDWLNYIFAGVTPSDLQAVIGYGNGVYMALLTAPCTPDDTGSTIKEPTGGNYARVSVGTPFGSPTTNWFYTGGKTIYNLNDISWPKPSASWGWVGGIALCDALTGGNLLWVWPLNPPTFISANQPAPTIKKGRFSVTLKQ